MAVPKSGQEPKGAVQPKAHKKADKLGHKPKAATLAVKASQSQKKPAVVLPQVQISVQNPSVRSVYHKELPKGFMRWLIGITNIDYLFYAPRLNEIAKKIGIDGEENLSRIFKILEACSSRIMFENDNFVILTMAIMLVESRWDPKAVNEGSGASGIMQVKPIAALDTLMKMDDATLGDFEEYVVPTLTIGEQASWVVLKVNVYYIKNLEAAARKIRKGQEAQLAEIRQDLKTSKAQTMELISQTGMLKNPTFCTGMGVFLLARLLESQKKTPGGRVDMDAVVGALGAYGGDIKAGYYSTKVLRTFWLITEYPNAVTLIIDGKLPINTALDLKDAGEEGKKVLQEILYLNRNPDDGIRFLKGWPIKPLDDTIPTTS